MSGQLFFVSITPFLIIFVSYAQNGVKTTAVKSFTVAGNFYNLLGQIRTVASNLELSDAAGMMNFGSPSVLVDGLSIAGK